MNEIYENLKASIAALHLAELAMIEAKENVDDAIDMREEARNAIKLHEAAKKNIYRHDYDAREANRKATEHAAYTYYQYTEWLPYREKELAECKKKYTAAKKNHAEVMKAFLHSI